MGSTGITLVGVDGSKESLATVEWTAGRAVRFGGRIHVLCIYALASYSAAIPNGDYAVLDDEALKRDAQQVVEEAVKIAKSRGEMRVSSSIEPSDLAGVLAEVSREVDLAIVGSRDGGSFADRFLDTVSSALPAHARCPVVVVPCHTTGERFMPVECIVAGVDGSEIPSSALRRATDEAKGWEAWLTTVSAVPIGNGTSMMAWTSNVDHSALLDGVRKGMGEAIGQTLHGRTMRVARHTLDGAPASFLVEFSTTVDLVVVGTRLRGGLAGVLLGSTSQAVLSHSTYPVMIVPSDHLDKAESAAAPDWGRR